MISIIKKWFVFLLFCTIGQGVFAQKSKIENLPKFDKKKLHFGFALGINSGGFKMDHHLPVTDSLFSLEVIQQSGFNLGIISDLHLGPLFDIRFVPTLSFAQRNLQYLYAKSNGTFTKFIKAIPSTYIDFPLLLKYRSLRDKNFALYFLGGMKYSIDLASQKGVDNTHASPKEIVMKLQKSDLFMEGGFGFDFFLEYFKFGIEMKWSYGLRNVFIQDNTQFSRPIDKLKSRYFILSFNFEG